MMSTTSGLLRQMSRLSVSATPSGGKLMMSSGRCVAASITSRTLGSTSSLSDRLASAETRPFKNTPTWMNQNFIQLRTMATNRKVIDAKNAKRLKIQQKKKKNANKPGAAASQGPESGSEDGSTTDNRPFLQHQEWVKFQQSISVSGFQTGQTVTATVLKKSRGGKQARRKREKELARLQGLDPTLAGTSAAAESTSSSAVATKFPAIRYSPEETQELLRQAYEELPERTGKRGNRNLRRQALRWKKVRKIRSDYKANIINAHERRMEHRHYKRQRVIQAKEGAVIQRQQDLEYQKSVLERWYRMQNPIQEVASDDATKEVAVKA